MTGQIRPSVTNPTIASLYNEITNGQLVLAPEFQRRFVWTQSHQEEFLDTVLKGFPFPEIYVSAGEVDIEAMKTIKHVIDGQQRLTTLKNYIEGNFDQPLSLVPSYKQLSNDQKKEFLSYEVVVRDLGTIDDHTVREVFRRINLTKFKLDSVEIHNAIYDGEFIQTAKSVLDSSDLSVFGVFKETEFSRMADLHFVLSVMATIESGGYFPQDREVETFVEKYNEKFPSKDATHDKVLMALNTVRDLDLEPDSMWFRKSNFFTLVCEIAFNADRLREDLRDRLLELEDNVMNNKNRPDNQYGEYYSYMYQGTNGRKARIVRSEMFREYCLK